MFTEQFEQLTDYGRYHHSSDSFYAFAPANESQVADALKYAAKEHKKIRVRGNHHSMNGSSLPREDECLLYTSRLNHCRFEDAYHITVGAGVSLHDLDLFLKQHQSSLKVCSDGGRPSVSAGGFLAAGGISERSERHGGYWESVTRISAFDVNGQHHVFTPEDELFRWLFGSMGQLMFVSEITLSLPSPHSVELSDSSPNREGRILSTRHNWEDSYPITLFVEAGEEERAKMVLESLQALHREAWGPCGFYTYPLRFSRFNPPLLSPHQSDLMAVGMVALPPSEGRFDFDALKKVEIQLDALLQRKPRWRRYIQLELSFSRRHWSEIFGLETYRQFSQFKRELDPGCRLNPGVVFPD